MSFRSNVILINCRLIKCHFDQVSFDQLSGHARRASEDPLKKSNRIWSGSRDPRYAEESVSPVGKAQLAGYLKVLVSDPSKWDASVSAATPDGVQCSAVVIR